MNTNKHNFNLLLLFLFGTLLTSCSEKMPIEEEEEPLVEDEAYIIDISKDSDADVMVLAEDGSYAVYDAETAFGGAMVYVNSSLDAPLEDGLTILLDEKNLPKSAMYDGRYIVFSNYTNNTCDAISYENDGTKLYFADIELPIPLDEYGSFSTRALSNEALTRIGCGVQFLGMATIVGVAVLGGGGVILGTVALAGVAATLVDNALQYQITGFISKAASAAGLYTGVYFDLKSGKPLFNKSAGFGVLGSFMTDLGGLMMKKGTENKDTLDIFSNKEYQLNLGSYFVSRRGVGSTFRISAKSLSLWEAIVLPEGIDWCNVKYNKNTIEISVQENNPNGPRTCKILVTPVYNAEGRVLPGLISISQDRLRDVNGDGIIDYDDRNSELDAQRREDKAGEYGVLSP